MSRSTSDACTKNIEVNLMDNASIVESVESLVSDGQFPELVVLNAGTLGKVAAAAKIGLNEILNDMQLNLYANKIIIDTLLDLFPPEHRCQFLMISSGASNMAISG